MGQEIKSIRKQFRITRQEEKATVNPFLHIEDKHRFRVCLFYIFRSTILKI